MRIYNLNDIDKKFRDTIDFIDDSDNEDGEYFLQVKVSSLMVAIHSYKEQLSKGIAIHADKNKIISTLEVVESILDFKPLSTQKKEIVEKLLSSFRIYGEHLPDNKVN